MRELRVVVSGLKEGELQPRLEVWNARTLHCVNKSK
jgi:hypothetical protein